MMEIYEKEGSLREKLLSGNCGVCSGVLNVGRHPVLRLRRRRRGRQHLRQKWIKLMQFCKNNNKCLPYFYVNDILSLEKISEFLIYIFV